MTGKQSAVLWLGLLLVILRAAAGGQWSALWGTISKPTTTTSSTPASGSTASNSSAENGSNGIISV